MTVPPLLKFKKLEASLLRRSRQALTRVSLLCSALRGLHSRIQHTYYLPAQPSVALCPCPTTLFLEGLPQLRPVVASPLPARSPREPPHSSTHHGPSSSVMSSKRPAQIGNTAPSHFPCLLQCLKRHQRLFDYVMSASALLFLGIPPSPALACGFVLQQSGLAFSHYVEGI